MSDKHPTTDAKRRQLLAQLARLDGEKPARSSGFKWGDNEPWWDVPDDFPRLPRLTKPGSFLGQLVAIAIALAVGWIGYRIVERRCDPTPATAADGTVQVVRGCP